MKNIYLKLKHRCKHCDCLSAYADCASRVSVQNTSALCATDIPSEGWTRQPVHVREPKKLFMCACGDSRWTYTAIQTQGSKELFALTEFFLAEQHLIHFMRDIL